VVEIMEMVRNIELPGRLLFAKVWGSHSHNTNVPTSDVDYIAMYALPNTEFLGMWQPRDTVHSKKPDVQAYEAGKFARLIMKGNPSIVECLFTMRHVYVTQEWQDLIKIRDSVLSQRVIKAYLGYAGEQLKKLIKHGGKAGLHTKGGKYSEKWAYHMIRLLLDAARIARGKDPVVWKEGCERDLLMGIRSGELGQDTVQFMGEKLVAAIEARKPWPLREEPDEGAIQKWLLGVRGVG
jgi:hypothetical protein